MIDVVGEGERRVEESRERGYWAEAWYELRGHPLALVGLALATALVAIALFAPVVAPYPPNFQQRLGLSSTGRPLTPGPHEFLLGTDPLGRDELSRLVFGARVSLAVGIGSAVLAGVLGLAVGGIAGMAGRFGQAVLMRVVDVVLSFPVFLLAVTLLAVTKPGLSTIIMIIGVNYAAGLARVIFGQVVSLRSREFVLAARAAGVRRTTILLRHVVPHVLPSVLVFCALSISSAIQLEAALSYVGIGIQAPNASWGNMIAGGQSYIGFDAWLVLLPAIAIMLAVVGFSLLGDGVRDVLDPTLERRRLRVAAVPVPEG